MAPFGASRAGLMSVAEDDIPDSDIYLQDDWGDNKLTDREDSATTTYNGVEGVYRPEWTIRDNEPTVDNEELQMTGGDGIFADINLNLDETITWTWDVFVPDIGGGFGDSIRTHLWAEQTENDTNGRLFESYFVDIRNGERWELAKIDSNGENTVLVFGTSNTGESTVEVTRSPSGEYNFIIDGTSQGTETDTDFTDPQVTAIIGNDGSEADFREMKVN